MSCRSTRHGLLQSQRNRSFSTALCVKLVLPGTMRPGHPAAVAGANLAPSRGILTFRSSSLLPLLFFLLHTYAPLRGGLAGVAEAHESQSPSRWGSGAGGSAAEPHRHCTASVRVNRTAQFLIANVVQPTLFHHHSCLHGWGLEKDICTQPRLTASSDGGVLSARRDTFHQRLRLDGEA